MWSLALTCVTWSKTMHRESKQQVLRCVVCLDWKIHSLPGAVEVRLPRDERGPFSVVTLNFNGVEEVSPTTEVTGLHPRQPDGARIRVRHAQVSNDTWWPCNTQNDYKSHLTSIQWIFHPFLFSTHKASRETEDLKRLVRARPDVLHDQHDVDDDVRLIRRAIYMSYHFNRFLKILFQNSSKHIIEFLLHCC